MMTDPVYMQPGDRAVAGAQKRDAAAGGNARVFVTWIAIEIVRPKHDIAGILDEQVVSESHPERVSRECDSAHVLEVDVDLHVAEHIAGDRDVPFVRAGRAGASGFAAGAYDTDVGGIGPVRVMLNCAAGDGDFAHAASCTVE